MTGAELLALAQSGANINVTIALPELLAMTQETDRLATERARLAFEREAAQKEEEHMWTVAEFCTFWNIKPKTLRNWEKRNVLRLTQVGGELRIDPEEQKRLRATRRIPLS